MKPVAISVGLADNGGEMIRRSGTVDLPEWVTWPLERRAEEITAQVRRNVDDDDGELFTIGRTSGTDENGNREDAVTFIAQFADELTAERFVRRLATIAAVAWDQRCIGVIGLGPDTLRSGL